MYRWSIQLVPEPHRANQPEDKLNYYKNKRDYQISSQNYPNQQAPVNYLNQQSPSPVNYYQNSPSPVNYYQNTPHEIPNGYGLKPPGSPYSNQFYQATGTSNNFQNILSKCSEKNLYYCKELLAKQLVQHVKEMVTYKSGIDPHLLAIVLGSSSYNDPTRHPFTRTEIRTETDFLDNEIQDYVPNYYRPDKQINTYWNPAYQNFYATKPMLQSWNDLSLNKITHHEFAPYDPKLKPYFKVPHANGYYKPQPQINAETPLTFPPPEHFRESKDFPLNHQQKTKKCNPCLANSNGEGLIDIRNKLENETKNNTNESGKS